MDDIFEGFGNGSGEDNFDLAALRFLAELDRQGGKDPLPGVRPKSEAAEPPRERAPLIPDDEVMPDLADGGVDSVVLSLMSDPPAAPRRPQPRPVGAGKLTRPVPRKSAKKSAPADAEATPLSDLAQKAARLFDSLPTEDQLLAYTLLQKLAKGAGHNE